MEKEEKEQTLRSLIKHCDQIEERVAVMRVEKKQLKKKSNNGYPVRDEIFVTQKENQLLEEELTREKTRLEDYQLTKQTFKSEEELAALKKVLSDTKAAEVALKQ